MWLRMNIQNGQASGEFEMDQAGSNDITAALNGFFGAFGIFPKHAEAKPSAAAITSQIVISKPTESKQTTHVSAKASEAAEQKLEKPQLINSERHLTVSLGEQMVEAYKNMDKKSLSFISDATETNEDYKATGIKYKDGVAHYKCRYWCKNHECRNKGNLYIVPGTKTVDCHNCGREHEVREAVHGEPLQQDTWGNFFIADHLA